jgi:hypothetical protein
MVKKIATGNFYQTSREKRGWVLGHFMDSDSPLKTQNCELKWGIHKKGEKKEGVGTNDKEDSLAILIKGKFRMKLSKGDVVLEKEGDFVFYGSGLPHSWYVEEDCLLLTLRWPSLPKDQATNK